MIGGALAVRRPVLLATERELAVLADGGVSLVAMLPLAGVPLHHPLSALDLWYHPQRHNAGPLLSCMFLVRPGMQAGKQGTEKRLVPAGPAPLPCKLSRGFGLGAHGARMPPNMSSGAGTACRPAPGRALWRAQPERAHRVWALRGAAAGVRVRAWRAAGAAP